MSENNELNDIILNKSNASSSNKKIILAVVTLGLVLIIVVMIMNSLNSNSNKNLPQAVLPPKPQTQQKSQANDEPLFEDVKVVQDKSNSDADLDKIAKKIKAQSLKKDEVPEVDAVDAVDRTPILTPKKVVEKKVIRKKVIAVIKKRVKKKAITQGRHYVQVGSFSKYKPNKQFLGKITKLGYSFSYHKIGHLNKVLVGPFKTLYDARKARKALRSKVEPGAFLIHL